MKVKGMFTEIEPLCKQLLLYSFIRSYISGVLLSPAYIISIYQPMVCAGLLTHHRMLTSRRTCVTVLYIIDM